MLRSVRLAVIPTVLRVRSPSFLVADSANSSEVEHISVRSRVFCFMCAYAAELPRFDSYLEGFVVFVSGGLVEVVSEFLTEAVDENAWIYFHQFTHRSNLQRGEFRLYLLSYAG